MLGVMVQGRNICSGAAWCMHTNPEAQSCEHTGCPLWAVGTDVWHSL